MLVQGIKTPFFAAFLVILTSFLTLAQAQSSSHQDALFQKLQTQQMQVLTANDAFFHEKVDSYPWWAKLFLSKALSYHVNEAKDAKSEKCNSDIWKDQQKENRGYQKITQSIQNYVRNCETEIADGWDEPITNIYKTMMSQAELDPDRYPKARYVVFNLPGGIKQKGFLALHDHNEARPIILFRSGIFSNSSEFMPERYLFRMLFEQSNFNMLIIESNSGQEFIHRNKTIAMGGFDEGIQTFQIAKLLQDPSQPISKLISKVHLLGMSFGGHGVLYASLLNDLNARPKQKPVITSTLALCPLMNYRDTFDAQLSQGTASKFIEYWASHRMQNIEQDIPGMKSENFLENLIEYADHQYQGPLTWTEDLRLPQGIHRPAKYWQAQDFWKDYQNVKTPVMILATEKDPLVLYDLNAKRIQNGYMKIGNSNLKVISFSRGYHCSFPGAYMWSPVKNILQQYYLAFE